MNPERFKPLIFVAAGLLTGLGVVDNFFSIFGLICLAPLGIELKNSWKFSSAILIFLYLMSYHLAIASRLMMVPDARIGTLLLFLSLLLSLLFLIPAALIKTSPWLRKLPTYFLLPLCWLCFELILSVATRLLFGSEFPNLLQLIAIGVPSIRLLLGCFQFGGATVFVCLVNGLAVDLAFAYQNRSKKHLAILVSVPLTLLFFSVIFAQVRDYRTDNSKEKLNVVIVPVSLSSESLGILEEFLTEGDSERVDIVVWPETALTVDLRDKNDETAIIADQLREALILGEKFEFAQFVGVCLIKNSGKFNTTLTISPDGGMVRHDKQHLFPFFEYFPPLFRWVEDFNLIFTGVTSRFSCPVHTAQRIGLNVRGKSFTVNPLVCYDVCFFDTETGESSINLNIGRESFDPTGTIGKISLAYSKLQALVSDAPLVRCVAESWCGVIYPDGRHLGQMDSKDGKMQPILVTVEF